MCALTLCGYNCPSVVVHKDTHISFSTKVYLLQSLMSIGGCVLIVHCFSWCFGIIMYKGYAELGCSVQVQEYNWFNCTLPKQINRNLQWYTVLQGPVHFECRQNLRPIAFWFRIKSGTIIHEDLFGQTIQLMR